MDIYEQGYCDGITVESTSNIKLTSRKVMLVYILVAPYLTPFELLDLYNSAESIREQLDKCTNTANYFLTKLQHSAPKLAINCNLLDNILVTFSKVRSDIFLVRNELELSATNNMHSIVPCGCPLRQYGRLLSEISENFESSVIADVLLSRRYTVGFLFLVLVAAYRRHHAMSDSSSMSSSNEGKLFDHILLPHLTSISSRNKELKLEVSYSEWGFHNVYGFRLRDIRKRFEIDVSAILRELLAIDEHMKSFPSLGVPGLPPETSALLERVDLLASTDDSGSISCLAPALLHEC